MSAPGNLKDGEIYLSDYLLERLVQLDVLCMTGVPGDFNLTFLDLVEAHKKIEWIGCCNELNAGYAADGYARVKQVSLPTLDCKLMHSRDPSTLQQKLTLSAEQSQANSLGSKAFSKSQGGVKGGARSFDSEISALTS